MIIFLPRVETYVENGDSPTRVGMCVRVAATSTVNLNISSANLETLAESILSWRTQSDLEKKAVKKIQVRFISNNFNYIQIIFL